MLYRMAAAVELCQEDDVQAWANVLGKGVCALAKHDPVDRKQSSQRPLLVFADAPQRALASRCKLSERRDRSFSQYP